jgi:hypothetical protein
MEEEEGSDPDSRRLESFSLLANKLQTNHAIVSVPRLDEMPKKKGIKDLHRGDPVVEVVVEVEHSRP